MLESLAVVMIVETLQLRVRRVFGLTMEPTAERDLIVYDSLVLDKTLYYL